MPLMMLSVCVHACVYTLQEKCTSTALFFDTCFLILDKFYETFVEGLYVNRSADDDLTLMQSVKHFLQ